MVYYLKLVTVLFSSQKKKKKKKLQSYFSISFKRLIALFP